MAEIIEKKIKFLRCDCGKEFQIWNDGEDECSCRRGYDIYPNSIHDNKVTYLGYKCWDCEEYKEKLYGEDNCCAECLDNAVKHWEEMVKQNEKGVAYDKKRLAKAKKLRVDSLGE